MSPKEESPFLAETKQDFSEGLEMTTKVVTWVNFAMKESASFIQLLQKLRSQLPLLQAQYHVDSLEAFGSYVRGEQTSASDLDILVTFTETPSLLEFIALENHLSETLGINVDLVMKTTLKSPLQAIILEEAIPV
jgi:predicted nucleotidyltransferase